VKNLDDIRLSREMVVKRKSKACFTLSFPEKCAVETSTSPTSYCLMTSRALVGSTIRSKSDLQASTTVGSFKSRNPSGGKLKSQLS
jgi:hypothetical protein